MICGHGVRRGQDQSLDRGDRGKGDKDDTQGRVPARDCGKDKDEAHVKGGCSCPVGDCGKGGHRRCDPRCLRTKLSSAYEADMPVSVLEVSKPARRCMAATGGNRRRSGELKEEVGRSWQVLGRSVG